MPGDEKSSENKPHVHNRPQWAGRDVTDSEHGSELDREAALHEFDGKLPRHEAEDRAYGDYKHKQHAKAAAHHLQGIRLAEAAGDMREGKKHGLMYQMHLKELGHDAVGPVPKEVQQHLDAGLEGEGPKFYSFKPHRGDIFVLPDGLGKKESAMADNEQLLKLDWERHNDSSGGYLETLGKSERGDRTVYRTWEVERGARPSQHVLVKVEGGNRQTTLGYFATRDEALNKASALVKEGQQLGLTPMGVPQTAKAETGLGTIRQAMGKADGAGLAALRAAQHGGNGGRIEEGSASASSASSASGSMDKGSMSASASESSSSSMDKGSMSASGSASSASGSASAGTPPWVKKADEAPGLMAMAEKCAKCGMKDCKCGNMGKAELCKTCGKAANLCKCSGMGKSEAFAKREAEEKATHEAAMDAGRAQLAQSLAQGLPGVTLTKSGDAPANLPERFRNLYVAAKFALEKLSSK